MPVKILLTGSSGNLGTYLLSSLVKSSQADRIWCLNRSADVGERQPQLLAARGLPTALPAYVEFHRSDTSDPELGLPHNVYEEIASQVTHIFHVAWPVDWNKSFASFEPSVRGVKNLIDLATASEQAPLLFYVSSVAAAGNWGAVPGARETVPEEEIDDWKVARFGYGQSKLVAERLLAEASRNRGVTTAVCRVGQVAGPVEHGSKGVWPPQEWLPSLIASSRHMGILPRTLGPAEKVDWVPVDLLSTIMVEMLFDQQPPQTIRYHHITNPNIIQWHSLVPAVQDALLATGGRTLVIKDLEEWVDALEHGARREDDLTRNPAIKLLSFFQSLKDKVMHLPKARAATLEVKQSTKRSPTLARLEPVNQQWMSLWMQQWSFN